LVRLVVDGNGPCDLDHWLIRELTDLDAVYRRVVDDGPPTALARATVRALADGDPSVAAVVLRSSGHEMVAVPTAESGAIPEVAADGHRYLPCFTDPDLLVGWVSAADSGVEWAIAAMKLGKVHDLAAQAGLAGILINPGTESAVLPVQGRGPSDDRSAIPAGSAVSFGEPRDVSVDAVSAMQLARLDNPGIKNAYLTSLVYHDTPTMPHLTLFVEFGAGYPRDLSTLGVTLSQDSSLQLDLADAGTGLGQLVIHELTPIYAAHEG
jgi:hypothetical protein